MVRLFFPVVAALALVTSSVAGLDICKIRANEKGSPHGQAFDYYNLVEADTTVTKIHWKCGRRVDGVGLTFKRPGGSETYQYNGGGKDGKLEVISLADDEYITGMEYHTAEHNDHMRIFYLAFTTTLNNTHHCGRTTKNVHNFDAPKGGYRLIGLFGKSGEELDACNAIWGNPDCEAPVATGPIPGPPVYPAPQPPVYPAPQPPVYPAPQPPVYPVPTQPQQNQGPQYN